MIKKYMNILYSEIEQIRRKLDSGKMKYYGDKKYFADAGEYVVFLKDGHYFIICIGTKFIPKIHKKDVLFISKSFIYDLCGNMKDYNGRDFMNSNTGFIRYSKKDSYMNNDYVYEMYCKYKIDYVKEIDTGYWD